MSFKIANVVSSCSIGVKVNLHSLFNEIKRGKYEPQKFGALIIKSQEPKATCLLFESGNMVVIGCKSEVLAKEAANYFVNIFKTVLTEANLINFRISNIVVSVSLNHDIDLDLLDNLLGCKSRFLPEFFPGLHIKREELTIIVFRTGKVIFTGSPKMSTVHKEYEGIILALRKCRK